MTDTKGAVEATESQATEADALVEPTATVDTAAAEPTAQEDAPATEEQVEEDTEETEPQTLYDAETSLIEDPVVSLIVPMYNVREDVGECIESIVNQTLKETQVILVDDGSTDDTGDIARDYAERFPNVEYHRKPNGGLGHARNYGVPFARGTWLMFPDSDDIIMEYALEEMVALGEKNGSDIVLGDVKRFDTKGTFNSGLHRRAFKNMHEVDHITKNHDLLYDTTAWNKLFRRDFYEEHDFKWVEGRLYEDIPVTVPAHFMANRISFLDKVVYMWRVRDGQSASITQKRMEMPNFLDRFHAVQEVDKFFDAHVDDHSLVVDKDIKWLTLDLKMYIDVFPEASDEFRREVTGIIADYIKRIDPQAFVEVPASTRIKYRLIERGDIDELLRFLEYEKEAIDTLKIVRKGGRFIGKFPFEGLSEADCDMTEELRQFCLLTQVKKATLTNDVLAFDIVALVPQISQKKVTLEAWVADMDGNKIASFDVARQKVDHSIEIRNNLDFKTFLVKKQPSREFKLSMPLAQLSGLEAGDYAVYVQFTDGELVCDPKRLEGPWRGSDPRPYGYEFAGIDKTLSLSYDLSWRAVITVRDIEQRIEDTKLVDGGFEISFADGSTRMVAVSDVDEENESGIVLDDLPYVCEDPQFLVREATYHYDLSRHSKVAVKEDLIQPDRVGQSIEKVPGTEDEYLYHVDELWKISADKGACLRIDRYKPGIVVTKCERQGNRFELAIEMPYQRLVAWHKLALVGLEFGAEVVLPCTPVDSDDGTLRWKSVLDLGDAETTATLRDDEYQLMMDVRFEDGSRSRLNAYAAKDRDDVVDELHVDGYKYVFDRRSARLWLSVLGDKKPWEGRLREQVVERVLYPLMRLMPLKKNLVMFESYWGMSCGCNPKAIYDYIDREHPEYECVWSVRDERIPVGGRAKVCEMRSLPYYYTLARCKYLVNNVNFVDEYEKRPGQIEVQTMHGTPLKTLGLDVKDEFPDEETRVKFLRRCDRWDYLVVQSKRAEAITSSCYAYKKQFLRTGYPRNDELLQRNTPEVQREIKERLGVDPDSQLVLYLPTWRVRGRFDLELNFAELAKEFGDKYTFALRRHYFAVPGFTHQDLMGPALDFTYEKSIDDLYLAADVIITDYSSVMFDYVLLDRPMLFFVYDLEAYRDELRGFNIDLESETPGPLLKTTEEVAEALRDLDKVRADWSEAFERFKDNFASYETDHSTQDVFNTVFKA